MRSVSGFPYSLHLAQFLLLLLTLLLPEISSAHETWVLTPAQIAEWDAKPKPEIFTTITATNVTIYTLATLFLVGWILLHYTGARADHQTSSAKITGARQETPMNYLFKNS